MSAMSSLSTDVWLHPDWSMSNYGALWTRTLADGRLAAIWRYRDHTGADVFKLLTDRDNGDYVALEFAVAAAIVVESLDAVAVSRLSMCGFAYDGDSMHGVPL